jgi:hypothetical protein
MPQRFYIDESDLNGQLTKLDENLFGMLDFAYLHEDMVNAIDELMSEWGKENISTYTSKVEEFNNLPEDQKKWYESSDEWLSEDGRWWISEFEKLDNDNKKLFLQRYRLTISYCLHSSTFDYEALKDAIEKGWESISIR